MNLTKAQREQLKQKFGGHCAYCGCVLGNKWHADHFKPVVRIGGFVKGKFVLTGELQYPENDTYENLVPACAKCNNRKGGGDVEGFRTDLNTMVQRLNDHPRFGMYQHAKRFGRIHDNPEPVVFFFETWGKQGDRHGAPVQFPREDQSGTCPGSNGVGNQGEKTDA